MLTLESKKSLLKNLHNSYRKCTQCPLGELGRTNIVFGEGNPNAQIIFVGEGPGKDEDLQGMPFIGKSGQLLNKIFLAAGINRNEIFITNIVKCRPPNNRQPLMRESSMCMRLLLYKQIKIINPKVICTLGACATQALLFENTNQKVKISQIRGIIKEKSFFMLPNNILIIPTFHPAFILRTPSVTEIVVKDIALAKKLCSEIT
jgi:uracil-DNA glycosylase